MINTYNESSLHATLKRIYALETNGLMEVRLDDTQWICDILDENGNAIEIQTANLSALKEKAEYILETGRKIKIVHPVASIKWIELYKNDGTLLHRKRSPKKATLFDSLRGMTQICPLFLNENCCLEILYCEITEMRREMETPSQNQTKTRCHLKNWVSMGKRLEKIIEKKKFTQKNDWEELLPETFRQSCTEKTYHSFRQIDLYNEMKKTFGVKKAKWSPLLIWLFLKMDILEIAETIGKSKYFRLRREITK